MNAIQSVGIVPQFKTNFKAEQRAVKQPMSEDEIFLKMVEDQKKKEKKQKYSRWAMMGLQAAALISMIAIGVPALKQLFKKKGSGPTDAERELGVKTKEEIMKMFKDVSNEKSFEELIISDSKFKGELDTIIDKMNRPEAYKERCLEAQNSFLFYGPPGTGKTSFVNAICKKFNIKPFVFDIGELKGGYQGTLEKNMNTSMETFLGTHRAARAKDPNYKSVFFFDECDEVIQKAIGPNQNSDNQICTRLKRNIEQLQKEEGVYLFFNSNKHPDQLESAIVSRVKPTYIPRPSVESLVENHTNHFKNGGTAVADDLKQSSDRLKQFYEILSREDHGYAYREQAKYGWKLVQAPEGDGKISLNDFINAVVSSAKELNLTEAEIEELKRLLV